MTVWLEKIIERGKQREQEIHEKDAIERQTRLTMLGKKKRSKKKQCIRHKEREKEDKKERIGRQRVRRGTGSRQ